MANNPYQFSLRNTRLPGDVLDEVAARPLPGIAVAERGTHYLVLRPKRRHRFGSDIAVAMAVAIALAVLIASAWSPAFIALLPRAVLPAIPLLLDRRRPDLAVSAVIDDFGGTRVTVHGEASDELAAAVDALLGTLPEAPPQVDQPPDVVASTA